MRRSPLPAQHRLAHFCFVLALAVLVIASGCSDDENPSIDDNMDVSDADELDAGGIDGSHTDTLGADSGDISVSDARDAGSSDVSGDISGSDARDADEGDGSDATNMCSNVVCDSVPASVCVDGQTLEIFSAPGSCQAGDCVYPSASSECAYGCDSGACQTPAGFVISEVLYDTAGYPDTGSFVEIHGPADASVDGLTLVGVNGNASADYTAVSLSGHLDSEGLFVVAYPGADAAAVADQLDQGVDLQNGPDSVQLRYDTQVLDALAYGSFDSGSVAAGEGTPTADTDVGESLQRDAQFTDTDDNAVDFMLAAPTPGTPYVDTTSCGGTPLTEAQALALLGGQSRMVVASATIQKRGRTCDTCPWVSPAPEDWVITYLTYSGGVTTTWKPLLADMNLVLFMDGGQPKVSIQHESFVGSGYDDTDGMVYSLPPTAIQYPKIRAWNHSPESSSRYIELEITRTQGVLELGNQCARWTADPFGMGGPPHLAGYAALFTWQ
jgi:hypothetical protein